MQNIRARSIARSLLLELRHVMQAVDSHSRRLVQRTGLSVPQLLALQTLAEAPSPLGTSELAQRMHLSQATVSALVDRLEARGLVERRREGADRRRVQISLTDAARMVLAAAPPTLDDGFIARLAELPDDELQDIARALRRLSGLVEIGRPVTRTATRRTPAPKCAE